MFCTTLLPYNYLFESKRDDCTLYRLSLCCAAYVLHHSAAIQLCSWVKKGWLYRLSLCCAAYVLHHSAAIELFIWVKKGWFYRLSLCCAAYVLHPFAAQTVRTIQIMFRNASKLSVNLSVCLAVYNMSVCLSIHPYFCPSSHLSVCLC